MIAKASLLNKEQDWLRPVSGTALTKDDFLTVMDTIVNYKPEGSNVFKLTLGLSRNNGRGIFR